MIAVVGEGPSRDEVEEVERNLQKVGVSVELCENVSRLEINPLVGQPTWGGPHPRDFRQNPHYPRGD